MRADIELNASGDLLIENGDFVIAPSDNQHIFDILTFATGFLKQFPTVGCNAMNFLKSDNASAFPTIAKPQLQADGYSIPNMIAMINRAGQLNINFPLGVIAPTI